MCKDLGGSDSFMGTVISGETHHHRCRSMATAGPLRWIDNHAGAFGMSAGGKRLASLTARQHKAGSRWR